MRSIVLLVPGPIETRSGGYEYDRQMAAALRCDGWTVETRELTGEFPEPSAETLKRVAALLADIPDAATVLVDGLAFGAMPDQVAREATRLRLVPIVHMPLAFESGIDAAEARRRESSERRALAGATLVVVSGKITAETVARYGVPGDRIALVEPGTDPSPLAAGSGDRTKVHLLCVAAVGPGKGYDVLFRALASVASKEWRLTCVGSLAKYPETVRLLREQLRADDLEEQVSFVGELDAAGLADAYDRADLFVLATRHETYGMAVAEAIARGLPVVSSDTGAIAELVGDEAGIVVPPDDASALAHALASALDPRVRARLAQGSQRMRQRLRTWQDAAKAMAWALERIDR